MKRLLLVSSAIVALTILFGSGMARAAIIRVGPTGNYTHIQPAIDASVNGDEIIVQNGVYRGFGNVNLDFHNNSSTYEGGGIALSDSSASIINCVISGNSAASGAGVYSYNSSPTLANCTIAGNSATDEGGGITSAYDSSVTVVNCILWGDQAPVGQEIALIESVLPAPTPTSLAVSYSDVQGGQAGAFVEAGNTLTWGAGNINANPQFVGGGDYHLLQGSPCIDAGSDAGVYNDFDGDIRPQGAGFDMGFDEYSSGGPLAQIAHVSPANESLLSSAPTFTWAANGGANNRFAVDLSYDWTFSWYYSTFENMRQPISGNSWTMTQALWNAIPSGSYVYWRMRGADLADPPVNIITGGDVWWLYKL